MLPRFLGRPCEHCHLATDEPGRYCWAFEQDPFVEGFICPLTSPETQLLLRLMSFEILVSEQPGALFQVTVRNPDARINKCLYVGTFGEAEAKQVAERLSMAFECSVIWAKKQ